MLSKTEREYLQGNLKLSKNYEYKITHSIRNKIKTFYQLELPLLQNSNWVEDSRCEASRTDWLGKLTSCQSGLTPPKETRLFLTKNHNGITEFGNTVGGFYLSLIKINRGLRRDISEESFIVDS
uniref:Uncharacterized protein n=1 Tax=uncultured marine thaumarchaeote KM3_04_H11 TaxID=1455968 RepID=A0A075G3T0_9ARCH|nr:hypothetical protein [uncultured marine thaumarchaeote KM3_04_H11]